VGLKARTSIGVYQNSLTYMCTLVAAMVVSYNEVTKYGGGGITFPVMVLAAGIFFLISTCTLSPSFKSFPTIL